MPTNYMDRVEVLAGPNIGVNGIGIFMAGSVGGTVGVTTKKAQEKPMLNAGLSWSSDSYYTQTVDVGKRFGKDGAWGVRINALNALNAAKPIFSSATTMTTSMVGPIPLA